MKLAMKHGENPHQEGYVIIDATSSDPLAIGNFKTASGEPLTNKICSLGWITLTDLSRGVDTLTRIAAAYELNLGKVPCIGVILQHGNTCGAACGQTDDVLRLAIESNYRGSFGAFLVTNVPLTKEAALHLRQWMPAQRPFSGIAAPFIDPMGAEFFTRKTGTCHQFHNPALATVGVNSLEPAFQQRRIRGATLSQSPNNYVPKFPADWERSLIEDMCLAWGVCASSSSIAIAIAKDGKLLANAVGQPSRAGACELALVQAARAGKTAKLRGAAVASDSFFSFADGIDMLARKKVRAISATSGSIHDRDVAEHARQFDVIFHTVPDREARVFAGH